MRPRSRTLLAGGIAACMLTVGGATRALHRAAPRDTLAVSRVVLFQNGIAYVERRGSIQGTGLEIEARRDQLDDVLKSLTVVDAAGGRIASVRVQPARPGSDLVRVRLGLTGGDRHDLTVAYMTEASGWRPTYRLVARGDGTVRVQGFAMVDNRAPEPWTDVALALSTEVPLSFRYALQDARAASRPRFGSDGRLVFEPAASGDALVRAPGDQLVNDVQVAQGLAANRQSPQISNRAGRVLGREDDGPDDGRLAALERARAAVAPRGSAGAGAGAAAVDPLAAIEQNSPADGFTVESPARFTLGAGESGMVPFADASVRGETVLLFKPAPAGGASARRPFRAVFFQNPLDAPLLTGPVAVYDAGRYLGDGVTATIPSRAHAFVAYGLDPGVDVEATTEQGRDEVRAVALRAGVLELDVRAVYRARFRVRAAAPWRERVFVFAPAVPGYEPRALPPGAVVAGGGYFLPIAARQSDATATLELVRRERESVDVTADPRGPHVAALLALVERAPEAREHAARLRAIADRTADIREERARVDDGLRVERDALAERRDAVAALRDVPSNAALRARLGASVAAGVARVDALARRAAELGAEELTLRQEWYARLRSATATAPASG